MEAEHNEEILLYYSRNIIRVIKFRSTRWVRHIIHMGKMKNAHELLVRKAEREEFTWEI
jgi:hypothetical protein